MQQEDHEIEKFISYDEVAVSRAGAVPTGRMGSRRIMRLRSLSVMIEQ